jgi:outer membrane usher protein
MPAYAGITEGAEPAFYEVLVNGVDTGLVSELWKSDKDLVGVPTEWEKYGILIEEAEKEKPQISSAELGIKVVVDENASSVSFDVPAERLPSQSLGGAGADEWKPSPAASGVLLNYNIAAAATKSSQGVSVAHEVRTGGKFGVFSTSGQLDLSSTDGASYLRGQTRYQYDDYNHLRSYQAGDVMSGGVDMGGIRITRDPAGMDPLHPTYPLPTLGGIALDPSTVRVLSNQVKVSQYDVTRGPFVIERFPLAQGRNATEVVVRDKFGREQVISNQQLYFTPQVLRKGLTTWDVAAGAIRQGQTNNYGPLGANASIAHGVTDRWTFDASAQANAMAHNASVGSRVVLGSMGVAYGSVGKSTSSSGSGSKFELGYDYQGPTWGVNAYHQQTKNYWQLANADRGSIQVSEETHAALTFTTPDRQLHGRVGVSDLKTLSSHTSFLDGNLNWEHNGNTISASALYDLKTRQPAFEVAYRHNFGDFGAYAVAHQAPNINEVRLGGNGVVRLKSGTTIGYAGEVSEHGDGSRYAAVRGNIDFGNGVLMAEVRDNNGQMSVSGNYSGALHFGTGGIQRLHAVSDGYAVVSIPGVAGIPVKLNNIPVGKTDKAGQLIVGPLPSLSANKISIDDKELPPEVDLESSEATAVPRRLSGALVTFPVRTMSARTFNVTLDGKPVAVGAAAKSDKEDTQVGYEGELFLEHAVAGQKIEITHDKGSCSITIPSPLPAFGDVVTLACQGK